MSVISFIIFLAFPVEMVLRPNLQEGEGFATLARDDLHGGPSLQLLSIAACWLALMGGATIGCVDKRFGNVAAVIAVLCVPSTILLSSITLSTSS